MPAVEESPRGLDRGHRARVGRVEVGGDSRGVAREVLVPAREGVVVEQPRHEARGVVTPRADAHDLVEPLGQRLRGERVHELDRRVDAGGREDAARDGVEEGLGQLGVGQRRELPARTPRSRPASPRGRGSRRRAAASAARASGRGTSRTGRAAVPELRAAACQSAAAKWSLAREVKPWKPSR